MLNTERNEDTAKKERYALYGLLFWKRRERAGRKKQENGGRERSALEGGVQVMEGPRE